MPSRLILTLFGLMACSGGTSRVEPADVRAAIVHMDVSLGRAADAHAQRHPDAAVEAWRDAHQQWDRVLAPGLEKQIGRLETLSLELHLARIRAELDQPDGDPAARIQAFQKALESPVKSLPPAPGGP